MFYLSLLFHSFIHFSLALLNFPEPYFYYYVHHHHHHLWETFLYYQAIVHVDSDLCFYGHINFPCSNKNLFIYLFIVTSFWFLEVCHLLLISTSVSLFAIMPILNCEYLNQLFQILYLWGVKIMLKKEKEEKNLTWDYDIFNPWSGSTVFTLWFGHILYSRIILKWL